MSADNWTTCPRCHSDALSQRAKLSRRVQDEYGKIPIADWDKLRARAELPIDTNTTFREDWEIGLDEAGEFYVSYRGACSVCGLTFNFTHSQVIDQPHEANIRRDVL